MIRRFAIYLILTIATVLTVVGQTITRGPYLAHPEPGSITIRWEQDQAGRGKVYYGQNRKLKQKSKARLLEQISDRYLYEVALNDLIPGADYQYIIKIGRKKWNQHHFKAPPGPDEACSFAISGDSRSRPQIFSKIVSGITGLNPDFVISMGDLVADGGEGDQWDKYYFQPARELIAERPYISTLGDHEGRDDGVLFKHFLFPELESDKLWYSFDYGMVHFISLDYRHADSEEMQTWFAADMEASQGRWNIVFMHRPVYNLGGHRSFWGNPTWPDLFRDHRVDVVFGGHSHIYERFYPVYSDHKGSWTITYITTGGAGAGLYDAVQHPVLAYSKSMNHYVSVDVNSKQLNIRTYKINGELMDSLVIAKAADNTQGESYLAQGLSRDELDVMGVFAHAISRSLDSPPLFYRPAHKTVRLKTKNLLQPIQFTLRLSDSSLVNYKMDPFSGELLPGEDQEIELKIWSKTDLKVSGWGEIDPPFWIMADYKQGRIQGSVQGKPLCVRSWGD